VVERLFFYIIRGCFNRFSHIGVPGMGENSAMTGLAPHDLIKFILSRTSEAL